MEKQSVQENPCVCPVKREPAPAFAEIRTDKPTQNRFRARIALLTDGIYDKTIGCDAVVLAENGGGKDASAVLSGRKYKTVFTFSDLPADTPGGFELIVRPYAADKKRTRVYGESVRLLYRGETDSRGRPVLRRAPDGDMTLIACDSTYIFNKEEFRGQPAASQKRLQVRNPGNEETELYRAAYYRFVLDADTVRGLADALKAELRVFADGSCDSEGTRRRYPMTVTATAADWTENNLTYDNRNARAAAEKPLATVSYTDKTYLIIDVLDYLKGKKPAPDGSLTVSFAFTNEGHGDALLTYLASRTCDHAPVLRIAATLANRKPDLERVANEGFEPWGYAEKLVGEWFDNLVPRIFPKSADGKLTEHEIGDLAPRGYDAEAPEGDFTCETEWRKGTDWRPTDTEKPTGLWETRRYVRTLQTLGTAGDKRFLDSPYAGAVSEYDEWGYPANSGLRAKATGYFHTEKLGGRFYVVDPLGNPGFAVGINTFTLGDSQNHKDYALAKYGSADAYYRDMTARLGAMGVNVEFGGDSEALLKKQPRLPVVVSIGVVSPYMRTLGLSTRSESYKFASNNTMNVFDPDFVTSTEKIISERISASGYAGMPNLFGYTTDNELPSGTDILERYLLVDPENPYNSFSYAVAWTWLAQRLGKVNPSLDDLINSPEHDLINSEFLAFVFARIYGIAGAAIRRNDPNHMYLGSRVNGNCRTDEYYLRVAGYYLDIISANLYGGLNPDARTITNFYRYSGKPFIVTEFYAKAKDSIDANGYPLANPTGAGILVKTQRARADYYEHYALAMIESRACVGWVWYRFRDNDQSLYRKAGTQNTLYMLSVNYNTCRANTYRDENGKVLTADEAGEVTQVYAGEPIASNQSVNKGFFNDRLDSTVTVYRYERDGTLSDAVSAPVRTPESPTPAPGTLLTSPDGTKTYTVGTKNENGITTETVLTVYDGQYTALCDSVGRISRHLMGLIRYLDDGKE